MIFPIITGRERLIFRYQVEDIQSRIQLIKTMPLNGGVPSGASGLLLRQYEAIRQMLNFNGNNTPGYNKPSIAATASEPSWKVLIYDEVGQSILTPLFNVKELRDSGVTLNILLHSER